ncbi:hypothetical protein F25303_14222 [Fusarium sp. NRRL 25303]|nr:hypothetical protein F25303_14222 [Fusarium sp. NRRL 25303]
MSGAEAALLGVGILCNAMQIMTFAKDSIHVYRDIRDDRAPDPKLDSYLKNAKTCFNEMNQTAAQIGPLGQTQQQIVDIGKRVHDCVDELQQQFARLHVDEPRRRGLRGTVAATKKSALALWRGKELEDAEHNLGRHEQLLHSLLLDQVCSQVHAAEITSLQAFQHLEEALRNIISQLVDGSTKVSDLVTNFSAHISDRVADEHITTRTIIGDHVTSAETTICHTMSQSIDQLRQELLEREQDRAFEKEYEQLLSSLWFPYMKERKNHILKNYPGTLVWIFGRQGSLESDCSSEYDQSDTDSELSEDTQHSDAETTDERGFNNLPDWLKSDSNVFWISGKPGSGKSFLMKSVAFNHLTVKHLKVWRSDVRILTHFFWKPGQLLQRNVEGMVLSLLCQALDGKTGLCQRLCTAQPSVKSKRSHSDWSLDELTEALVWSLEASPESFCIFLDGLDEAKELEHLPWPDWTNAQVIHKLLKVNDVKLCASSREEHAFCSFFKDAPQLKIQEFNNRDITLFVRERLDICGLECRDRDQLVRETVKSAEGVFLWVALVIDRLNLAIRHNYAIEMLQEILKQTPSDLTLLFTDIWGRIGDDAKLLSIQMAASRYFNLLIIAREIDEYLSKNSVYWHPVPIRMTSLLVIATAAQDQPMEAILRTGRVITVEDLLVVFSKAEKELKLASRGLLEVTSFSHDSCYPGIGDQRLREYELKQVNFIHRSAFDFLMDTEAGRKCLHACGSTRSDQASRLVAAHLIRARFIRLRHRFLYDPTDVYKLPLYQEVFRNNYLLMAIAISISPGLFPEATVREGLLDILKEWLLSGLFSGHSRWYERLSFHSVSSSFDLELVAASITIALHDIVFWDCSMDMKKFLDKYPGALFVDAIPIMLHEFTRLRGTPLYSGVFVELFKYIIHRLQHIATEEAQHQCAARSSIPNLHSWYITFCLNELSTPDRAKMLVESPAVELLGELRDTLLLEEDWHYPFLLEFYSSHSFESLFGLLQRENVYTVNGQIAIVVGNFTTAYQLFDEGLLKHSLSTLDIQIPQSVRFRFDVILIGDLAAGSNSISYCYVPEARFYNQIESFLRKRLHESVPLCELQSWPLVLNCSGIELSPIETSKASKYVIQELEEKDVDLSLRGSIIASVYLRNRKE